MGKDERVQLDDGSGSDGHLLNALLYLFPFPQFLHNSIGVNSASLTAIKQPIKPLRLWAKAAAHGPHVARQEVTCGPPELMQVAQHFNAKTKNKTQFLLKIDPISDRRDSQLQSYEESCESKQLKNRSEKEEKPRQF